jgi:diguanylate cyclase
MDNNAIQQQLTQWKNKYYQSITELEQQQQHDTLLRRSLGRLALVAQGLDPSLDPHLSSLRQTLRKKDQEQHQIEYILEKIDDTIIKMENNKDKPQTTGEILANLLSTLNLAKTYKKEARKLAKQFKLATNADINTLLPQLDNLLNQCLVDNSPEKSSGFSFGLFKNKQAESEQKSRDNTPISLVDDPKEIVESTKVQPSATAIKRPPTHVLLMQLLERLSLPQALTKRTTAIRRQIESGIEEQALPGLIDEIADIISALGSQVLAEKREYETFLKSLTARLNELDEQIHLNTDDDQQAFQARHDLGRVVEQEVRGISSHVEVADNLEQLKSTVNQRLGFLNQHFESYRQADHDQFEQSQKQIQTLKQRIHLMEQESIELRQSAMRSRDQALKDPLTGIWNRQALNEVLEKEYTRWQRYQKPLSIILWDIDFFKKVNDQYGHAAGDKVLKTIAQIFTSQTRDADFVSRYGGEEFMGIFPETELANALGLANKIREKIANSKFHYEGEAVAITASAGLACFNEGDTIDEVFKRADQTLYKAKEAGRNRCLAE